MKGVIMLVLAATISSAQAVESCTAQMAAKGFTNQRAAKQFGRECLQAQGAKGRTLTSAEISKITERMITKDSPLARIEPSDIGYFCNAYTRLSSTDRAKVWSALLTAITRPESNFRTDEVYWEADQNQYSIGLLQLSASDEKGYSCGIKNEADLVNPDLNLSCGTKILTRLVTRDGRIGGDKGHISEGGAAYWSTLRERTSAAAGAPGTGARDEIRSKVQALAICK